jgi:hypothetical protein
MRLTGAYAIIETLAAKLNCSFEGAQKYINQNYKSCNKYQQIAHDFCKQNKIGLFAYSSSYENGEK